ncbi:hypothetical protein QBC36DRAFT_80242 [Triangularia setosa]|uniref:Uncharacterized protein n=1 Tax=Triangularia setosa TaxID=2587417 RepID=A0AAN6VZJ8_9PEZI|nr:hypothetical protein QBC36DRAFT_80242 [Podospora setosa]
MAYQQPQYAYPPQGGAGNSYQGPPPVAPAYGQQQQPTYGYPQAPAQNGYQQPYQQQQAHHQQSWQPQAQSLQHPAYLPQTPAQSHSQASYQVQQPSYPPQQPAYSPPPSQYQASQPQYHVQQHQQPQYQPQFQPQQLHQPPYTPQHQPQQYYQTQAQPQLQTQQPQSQFPPGTYPLLTLPGHPPSKPTKLPFSLTLSSFSPPSQPLYTLTYNPTTSSLSLFRGPPSHSTTSPPIAIASFPSLSLSKSPASLGPYNYQIDSKFVSFSILPGQSLKWTLVSSGASAGAFILTPEGRKEDVVAKFVGMDAAGKLAVPGGTKKYMEGKLELLKGVTQAQMDEVFLTLAVELERKRRQAGGAKTAEGTWWGSQILSGVLSA